MMPISDIIFVKKCEYLDKVNEWCDPPNNLILSTNHVYQKYTTNTSIQQKI